MHAIAPADLTLRPFHLLDKQWALLVAGSERPNPMTVAWGGFGTLWNRPVVTVFVRPTRFTFELLSREPSFTLSFLPDAWRDALELCGTRSGRDTEKWTASGLVPEPSEMIPVPRVAQAELAFECRVLATADLDPSRFIDPSIERLYPLADYHRAYFGHVLAAWQSLTP
jgi:flavin reductase (DIM6/NTAB) family NADH-FMN oxidoreductase RutF